MVELYYSLSLLLIVVLSVVAWQDWRSKLIYLWSFYLLNIVSLVWLYFFVDSFFKYILFLYFVCIIFLDILDYFWKRPSFITQDWMLGNTWIYDYWLYLFIIVLFVNFIPENFIYFYISFTLSLIWGALFAWLLTKKRYAKHIPLFVYWFFIILFMLIFCLCWFLFTYTNSAYPSYFFIFNYFHFIPPRICF